MTVVESGDQRINAEEIRCLPFFNCEDWGGVFARPA
jgi:hypothetical protein